MKVVSVEKFQSDDGKLFDTRKEAVDRDAVVSVTAIIEQFSHYNMFPHEIAEGIVERREAMLQVLKKK
jgi:hypothetical protein